MEDLRKSEIKRLEKLLETIEPMKEKYPCSDSYIVKDQLYYSSKCAFIYRIGDRFDILKGINWEYIERFLNDMIRTLKGASVEHFVSWNTVYASIGPLNMKVMECKNDEEAWKECERLRKTSINN
jgi:hypothetical protein